MSSVHPVVGTSIEMLTDGSSYTTYASNDLGVGVWIEIWFPEMALYEVTYIRVQQRGYTGSVEGKSQPEDFT